MKIVNNYQCEICNSIHNSEKDALICESTGTIQPNYKIGDVVYINERCSRDYDKPFVKRTIIKIFTENRHEPEYKLNKLVQVGKQHYIGDDTGDALATEFYFLKLGDLIEDCTSRHDSRLLTENFVNLDA